MIQVRGADIMSPSTVLLLRAAPELGDASTTPIKLQRATQAPPSSCNGRRKHRHQAATSDASTAIKLQRATQAAARAAIVPGHAIRFCHHAVLAVSAKRPGSEAVCGHHRQPSGHGLQHRHAPRLGPAERHSSSKNIIRAPQQPQHAQQVCRVHAHRPLPLAPCTIFLNPG